MIDSKHLLAATASFVRRASGQVVTSVTAALCVAAVTNAVVGKAPVAQPAPIVLVAPTAPDAPPSKAARPPAASFTITGAVPARAALAHGFPMDGDPAFQTSLSRPFAALSGDAWAEPRAVSIVAAVDEPAPAPRRKAPAAGAARPAKPASVVAAAAVQPSAAQADPAEQSQQDGVRIFGFRTPKLLPSMGEVVGGVTAAAASLTRLARFD